ncbi:MAG: ATP synthase subunit I [Elainellaceae cyanobacterium]
MTDRVIVATSEQSVEADADPSAETNSRLAEGDNASAESTTDEVSAVSPGNLSISDEPDDSIQEYFRLRRELLGTTLVLAGIVVGCVWFAYSLNVALNYLIGAFTGLIYLNMLAKHVGQLGRQRASLGNSRLALLVGVILIASRVNQLEILPIFLGFLTYKAALIIYALRSVLVSD